MSSTAISVDHAKSSGLPERDGWPVALAALSLAMGGVIALYWDTVELMVRIWLRSDTFTHCFLIPPIALWLAWRCRDRLVHLPVRPWWPALGAMLLVESAWLLGQLAAVNALSQLAFTALLVLTVPLILGRRIAQEITFPLLFLFFAVPLGEFLIPLMMEWTADFTVMALRLSRVPVYREGLQFILSSGNWSVVEACSGVRYLIASITVGTLFAYLNFVSLKKRLLFCVVAVAVPVVANWLRAYMIVMLGHLSSNQLAVGADHLIYGWAFFGVVIFLMFMIGARWREDAPEGMTAPVASALPATSLLHVWVAAVLAVALTALAPLHYRSITSDEETGRTQRMVLPQLELAGGWQQVPESSAIWKPVYGEPSADLAGSYARDRQQVDLYIAYYRNQNAERKLISSTNVLVASKDPLWTVAGATARAVALDGHAFELRSTVLRPRPSVVIPGGNRLVWKWYWIDGRFTGNDYLARLYIMAARLRGQGDAAAAIVLSAPQNGAITEAAFDAFVAAHGAALNTMLRGASVPVDPRGARGMGR